MPLLPHAGAAYVERAKITDYLLNVAHPQGGPKARVLMSFGFHPDRPEELEIAFLALVQTADARRAPSIAGSKHVVEGEVSTPSGRTLRLRTVWKDDYDQGRPRLITAYPRAPLP